MNRSIQHRRLIALVCLLTGSAASPLSLRADLDVISREIQIVNDTTPALLHEDVVAREVQVFNLVHGATGFVDAVSREVQIYNETTPAILFENAVSREVQIYNETTPAILFENAVSREVQIYVNLSAPALFEDVIAREVNIFIDIHCTGDFNGDGLISTDDLTFFVNALSGDDPHPARQDAADINCDGAANGLDIQPFVDVLLSP